MKVLMKCSNMRWVSYYSGLRHGTVQYSFNFARGIAMTTIERIIEIKFTKDAIYPIFTSELVVYLASILLKDYVVWRRGYIAQNNISICPCADYLYLAACSETNWLTLDKVHPWLI